MLTAISRGKEATVRRNIDNDIRETDSSPEKHIGPVNGIENISKYKSGRNSEKSTSDTIDSMHF